jgi:hypothetical protein
VLTAEQTIATRRKYGGRRFPFVEAHDQHDLAKVNLRIGSVKAYFSNIRRHCQFTQRARRARPGLMSTIADRVDAVPGCALGGYDPHGGST